MLSKAKEKQKVQAKIAEEKRLTPLRWTIEKACSEFDINPRTLAKRIKTNGIEAGEDGKWGTQQIASAVYGDLYGEDLRKTRAEADILERKRAEMDRELIPAELVVKSWEFVIVNLRQIVIHSAQIPEEAKPAILKELQPIPIDEYYANAKNFDGAEAEDVDEPAGTAKGA